MEALGTLSGGIAHDFNNIIGAIYGYCELARIEAKGNLLLNDHLDGLMVGARRATALVQRILAFSRTPVQERRPIQLRNITAEAMQLLRAALPTTIEIQIVLGNDTPVVLADATQVHQILMNLGTNAAYAMRDRGGKLVVKLENCFVGLEQAVAQTELRVGRYARLTVADTGHGMDPETLARIYEPCFTTKPPGEGSGLGLAVVHGIVKAHDGEISVSSLRGEGTSFQVYFPAHNAEAEEWEDVNLSLPHGAGERILFVDDEVSLIEVGKQVLDHLGYAADGCSSARQALELVRAHPTAYALVITDQIMPGMTGTDLAKQLSVVCPSLPILIATGCADTLHPDRLRELGVRQLLRKPVSVQTLALAVSQMLLAAVAERSSGLLGIADSA
jgi:CheY-like chemotaxis protein